MDNQELWQATLSKIEFNLSRPNFLTWFQQTGILNVEKNVVTIAVPNTFVKEWLENKYHKIILHALREISSDIKEIIYIIGKQEPINTTIFFKDTAKKRSKFTLPPPSFDTEELSIKEFSLNPDTNLNPRYTFDTFVVGSFNELANAAAQSVIKNPGMNYNPLFIYGGVGLGKTHLIQAIGNKLLEIDKNYKVRYVSSEKYMGEIVDALKNQDMNTLKDKYRAFDLLIMDDIQFIARTEKMQEEFFHTFNSLYEKNKQIIISSDRPPQSIATLAERLRSRFEGGMIADLGLPDFETRLTILKTKTESKKIAIPEAILSHIAQEITSNIRELEGALNKIIISSKISTTPIDLEGAKKIIATYIAAPKKFTSAKKIIKGVAEFYDINEKELMNHSRKKDVVKPRQIAMYLMREELKTSFPSIGEKLGGRDHTTAMHSCEKIAQELKISSELEEEIRAIKEKILLL